MTRLAGEGWEGMVPLWVFWWGVHYNKGICEDSVLAQKGRGLALGVEIEMMQAVVWWLLCGSLESKPPWWWWCSLSGATTNPRIALGSVCAWVSPFILTRSGSHN